MSEQNFKAFELKVKPDEYGNLNKPLPDTVPKPNVGCGIRNDECFGLILPGLWHRKKRWTTIPLRIPSKMCACP